ncbi:MAG: DUF3899 domain-containing protein [Bacilli bacterium]
MSIFKNRYFITICCISILSCGNLILDHSGRSLYLKLVDGFFLSSLAVLLIGLCFFVIEGGTFNVWMYSLRRFVRALNPNEEKLKSEEEQNEARSEDEERLLKAHRFMWTKPLMLVGGSVCIVATLLSLI